MKTAGPRLLFAAVFAVLVMSGIPQETPQVRKRVDPKYPAILKQAGIEGDVDVTVTINEQGQIQKIDASNASDSRFIPAAMEAVRQWEFAPATKGGVPIKAEVTIPFKFRLGPGAYKSGHEALFKLKDDVLAILQGGLSDELKHFIDPEAYVIIGSLHQPLLGLLTDKQKNSLLVEGTGTKIEFSHLRTDATEKTAYLVLKTTPEKSTAPRFHTVVFMQGSAGKWKIETWHISQ